MGTSIEILNDVLASTSTIEFGASDKDGDVDVVQRFFSLGQIASVGNIVEC